MMQAEFSILAIDEDSNDSEQDLRIDIRSTQPYSVRDAAGGV